MAARRRGTDRDAEALASLEALVKALEAEARLNGTLHQFERWKATLPRQGAPAAAPGRPRRRAADPG